MPIYEYRCEHCQHEFETLQKMSDDPLTECPECKQPALKKLVSAAAFRLKGGGWYETDFKKGNQKNLTGSQSSDAKGGDSQPTSGDSKSSSDAPSASGKKSGSDTSPSKATPSSD